ncbi:MAG: hypothetical protein ABJA49_14590 [Betaproteobacteria bacterium]
MMLKRGSMDLLAVLQVGMGLPRHIAAAFDQPSRRPVGAGPRMVTMLVHNNVQSACRSREGLALQSAD